MSANARLTLHRTEAVDIGLPRSFMAQPFAAASTLQPASPGGQRKKLWELSTLMLCSVLGTCLSTAELRKVVAKCKGHDLKGLSDLAVHEEAVRGAAHHDKAGKLLHKALDRRHETTIKHFQKAKNADEVFPLWEEALRNGNIPGAYWALLTHPAVPEELMKVAFGDVHMLSHLVGAANRADIRRLTALEADNAQLTLKVEKQQAQLRDAIVTRDATIQRLNALLAQQIAQERSAIASIRAREQANEITALRELVADLQRRLSAAVWRCERTEQRYKTAQTALSEANAALCHANEEVQRLQDELEAVEVQLWTTHGPDGDGTQPPPAHLKGARLLYVGGRTGHIQQMRALVEGANAELLHHDGGQEERKGLLAGLVSRADAVFFPVDCISHDATSVLKRLCRQAGKPYFPLRSVSLTSFIAGLRRFERPALQGLPTT
jgi:hypothetical protein